MRNPFALIAVFVALAVPAFSEPPKIEHVIKLLQEAKESDRPVPLLEKAHQTLKEFQPSRPAAMAAAGIGRKRAANIQVGKGEKKRDALEAIAKAIKAAKEGGDVKPKIESAIAYTHSAS